MGGRRECVTLNGEVEVVAWFGFYGIRTLDASVWSSSGLLETASLVNSLLVWLILSPPPLRSTAKCVKCLIIPLPASALKKA